MLSLLTVKLLKLLFHQVRLVVEKEEKINYLGSSFIIQQMKRILTDFRNVYVLFLVELSVRDFIILKVGERNCINPADISLQDCREGELSFWQTVSLK